VVTRSAIPIKHSDSIRERDSSWENFFHPHELVIDTGGGAILLAGKKSVSA
jgi:hypothetical protein